jgi:hypothetical protein
VVCPHEPLLNLGVPWVKEFAEHWLRLCLEKQHTDLALSGQIMMDKYVFQNKNVPM